MAKGIEYAKEHKRDAVSQVTIHRYSVLVFYVPVVRQHQVDVHLGKSSTANRSLSLRGSQRGKESRRIAIEMCGNEIVCRGLVERIGKL